MKRRLLHVVRSLRPETGGLVEAVGNMSAGLRELGHAVTTVSLDPADAAGGGATIVLGRTSHGYGRAPDYVPWLKAHRREFDAAIVHGMWQQPGFGAWRALHGTDTPYFVFPHGMLDPWFKRTFPLKHAKKWLYWPWAEYRVLRDAAGVCFTAEEERRAARESFWLYRARELVTPLGLAVPPGEAGAQQEAFFRGHPEVKRRPFLLFLGRMHAKKGIEELFSAYAAVYARQPDAPELVMAGPCASEAYRRNLGRQAEELGIAPAVRWTGLLTGDEKWGALRACEAFVLGSHQENFGMAVVEALACGRPVLISDRINIWREVVADGAGLAAPDTVAGASTALARWQAMPGGERAAMARAAEACYTRRYTSRVAARHLLEAIASAARKPSPEPPDDRFRAPDKAAAPGPGTQ